ncbi:hypothetical protein [Natranaeroarchaeum aerophilus]|uniref:Uncharacterized protein n=1 Tax=Natranaeroarchaeum aerophilus TaxID=2917711 RepID=A0AAE3K7Y2_9EURY|nr:hypothetical protein [Natranaeroarchaeum aerophilus]MCL9814424.1 hypothetical protein [Natranaeroarchaeum aerophilus]
MYELLATLAVTTFVGDLGTAAEHFEAALTVDPLSAILVIVGQLIIGVSVLVFGYLTVRAAIDLVTPESVGQAPPRDEQ